MIPTNFSFYDPDHCDHHQPRTALDYQTWVDAYQAQAQAHAHAQLQADGTIGMLSPATSPVSHPAPGPAPGATPSKAKGVARAKPTRERPSEPVAAPSGSQDSVGDDVGSRPPTKNPYGVGRRLNSCTHCRKNKMRCDIPPDATVCKRCERGGIPCVVEGRKSRSAPNRNHSTSLEEHRRDSRDREDEPDQDREPERDPWPFLPVPSSHRSTPSRSNRSSAATSPPDAARVRSDSRSPPFASASTAATFSQQAAGMPSWRETSRDGLVLAEPAGSGRYLSSVFASGADVPSSLYERASAADLPYVPSSAVETPYVPRPSTSLTLPMGASASVRDHAHEPYTTKPELQTVFSSGIVRTPDYLSSVCSPALSEQLLEGLEALVRRGIDVQTSLDLLDRRYMRHPNIVPFLGICDKSTFCLVSHWMEEGTLLDFFRRRPSERRTPYILGTIRGLAFMHSLRVVHGDIKAINVLVDHEHNARLADFGLVSVLNNATNAVTNMTGGGGKGTIRHMAPELHLDVSGARTDRSDIYALAITIWETFTSKASFSHISNEFALSRRVILGERPHKPTGCENVGFTETLWDLLQQGWEPQPDLRPSLSRFIEVPSMEVSR